MKSITKFRGLHCFLSNFYLCPVTCHGVTGKSSEHVFQALKTKNLEHREHILNAISPSVAKVRGSKKGGCVLREDWDFLRCAFMLDVVRAKFKQHPDLKELLLSTGDAKLVEGNTWHDQYFGDCSCDRTSCHEPGKNVLGHILMRVRRELRANTP